jgi:type IV pilus assembly protein PilN
MIKINLLPQQKRAKSTNVEKDLVLFVLAILLIAGSIYAADYHFTAQINSLNTQISQKSAIRANLEQQVGTVNQVLNELKDIEGRIMIIKDVRIRQGLPVKYIDEIVVNIPEQKMWIETFTLNPNGSISLSGVALDNQSFASYVEKLRASNYIASVDTQRTSRRAVDGLGLVSFQCSVMAKEYFENVEPNGNSNG